MPRRVDTHLFELSTYLCGSTARLPEGVARGVSVLVCVCVCVCVCVIT